MLSRLARAVVQDKQHKIHLGLFLVFVRSAFFVTNEEFKAQGTTIDSRRWQTDQ